MRSRIVLILLGLTLMWSALIGRAAYLQLIPDKRLNALQKRQFETVVTLNARRGDVVDRNGHELAVSMTTYSLFMDPKIVEEPKKLSKVLAKALPQTIASTKIIDESIRQKGKRFVWIARHLDRSVKDSIEAAMKKQKLRGIGFVEESKRIYPNERLLSQVIGFVGQDEGGLEGLELRYNEQLRAANKKVNVRKDARGRPLLIAGHMFDQAPEGNDLQLTVDRELQFMLEQELAQTVAKHEADAAVGIILDAQTSEVLAMGSAPTFDANRAAEAAPSRKRNRVVTDSFEPGSTMKTFVMAGALAGGVIEPNTRIDCGGGLMRIGKRTIRDDVHKFYTLTASEILAVSSNIGTAKIAFRMGDKRVLEAYKNFGFGEKSEIDLPGEVRGIIQPLPWREHLLANVAFGQGITATPLQMANAYAAIANGGVLNRPYIVKSIRDPETGEISEAKPKAIRRVLSEDQAAKLRFMLASVTTKEGTGIAARVPGFPVAGKTGTAQKVNPNGRGYLRGGYVSSFAGFLPANDPKFVIYIQVDHPRKEYYGAAVAAPVFSRIAKFAVRRAGISPVYITQENVVPSADLEKVVRADVKDVTRGPSAARVSQELKADQTVPDLSGLTLREVLNRVTGTGVNVRIQGQGVVTHTVPAAGSALADHELTVFLSK
ncbi:MAG: penicillin-binding transpeptidase domain-containing protein [Bdellovibrionota bacterium]